MSGWWMILILALIGIACRAAWRIGRHDSDRLAARAYRDGFIHGVRMMRESRMRTDYVNIDPSVIVAVLEREGWTVIRAPANEVVSVTH